MKLHESDESQLTLWFAELARKSLVAKWGIYYEDTPNPIVQDDTNKRFDKYLDRGGISQFFKESMFRKILCDDSVSAPDGSIALSNIDGYSDSLTLGKDLVDKLKSLPKKYSIYVRAPQAFSDATKNLKVDTKISNQLSLISSSLINHIEFESGCADLDEWIWRNNKIEIKAFAQGHLYFKFDSSGYIADSYKSNIIQSFFHEMRAFYGACLAHNILYPLSSSRNAINPIVMAVESSGKFISNVVDIDTDLRDACYFYQGDALKTRYNKKETFEQAISKVKMFFSCTSPKLRTSAIWLLRAMLSGRSMDTILESAIALEVLLGDQAMSDKVGLTRLMSNRCAYALGKTAGEREDYIKFFEKFYKLRSEIVHTGKLSHSQEDEETVIRGLQLAADMLVYEQNICYSSE